MKSLFLSVTSPAQSSIVRRNSYSHRQRRSSKSRRRCSVDPTSFCGTLSVNLNPNPSPTVRRKHSLAPEIFINSSDSEFRKAVRQKTECSLPADENTDGNHLDAQGKIRRTSSMPSVCDESHSKLFLL